MTTSTSDAFILTFNAGKQHIDPTIFGRHLSHAFTQKGTGLPELIVFCLQEMAPLAQCFIGSYMINPYFQSYVSAVKIAASRHMAGLDQAQDEHEYGHENENEHEHEHEHENERRGASQGAGQSVYQDQEEARDSPYTLVASRNVGLTGIMLFALDPDALRGLKSTEVGFGAGDVANKGAVGLRMFFSKEDTRGEKRETELTFVGTHLSAHEWNLEKRNKNWESIVSGLPAAVFEDPKQLCGSESINPTPRASGTGEERDALLPRDPNEKALHDITIYKPGSHLFVAGDLNYRISKTRPSPD
ncbi:hypothetical protein ONZ43_g4560 [Nemania bipapillata]|uniref:Uncharacterized protein n=1 Tax=Nemania bipapillata TaxID=110536 RepID=A0ACC2IL15_9PEZI|nr:hypothetical protein ONZ43_g4560 [Nemania bipapillata]